MSRYPATAVARTVAPAGLAMVAFLILSLSSAGWLGWVVLCLTVAASWAGAPPPALGRDVPARLVLAAGVLGHIARDGTGPGALLAIVGILLFGLLLAERLLYRLARPWFRAANLPAGPAAGAAIVDNGTAWLVNSGAVALTGLFSVLAWPGWLVAAPAAGAAAVAGWLLADGWRRWRSAHRAELAELTTAIERHGPRFLLYFSAPPGSEYQARMWLPELERVGERFIVMSPERHNLAPIAAATSSPVVAYETFEALDAVMVPTLRAAFYVNNGMKNAHCVRFSRLTHVQLYHGDSDKAVTASPLNAMFDRIFVAGQAAIDRFAFHGVDIPGDKFRIVGRPQLAQLEVTTNHVSAGPDKTVLYAPTWVGAHADSNYCSLPLAEEIVTELLARGHTVIVRPHPYTRRHRESAAQLRRVEQLLARDRADTGRAHRWGRASTTQLALFDCMNRSHAMICDVSSVASEFLFTGKPFAITDMAYRADRFAESFPIARAAYVIDREPGKLGSALDDLLNRDPLASTRRRFRTYYLGDFPPESYSEAFIREAGRCLSGARVDVAAAAAAGTPRG